MSYMRAIQNVSYFCKVLHLMSEEACSMTSDSLPKQISFLLIVKKELIYQVAFVNTLTSSFLDVMEGMKDKVMPTFLSLT